MQESIQELIYLMNNNKKTNKISSLKGFCIVNDQIKFLYN